MADEKSKKRNFIVISSSDESESEWESSPAESDEDYFERTSSSTSCDDDDSEGIDSEDEEKDETEVDEDENEDRVDKDDVESMCSKVIQMIRGRSDLQELKLLECKAYLRRHGLRLSGTKEECIERIKEHWRIKDGNGETYYPRSSFKIDCTGDVCRGDVVLFNQKVHQIWNSTNNMTRTRSIRRRTVAGRIVKESYGAAKQQHTFTVEVLWSKGAKRLDPLTPLLVKGRNLYKMKTYRQLWKNEKERLEVLSEKHKRGAAARTIRAMRHKKAATETKKSSANNKDPKRRKHSHHLGPSRTRATTHENNYPDERRKVDKNMKSDHRPKFAPFQKSTSSKQNSRMRHQNMIQSNFVKESLGFPYNFPSRSYHFQSDVFPRELRHFPSQSHQGFVSTPHLPYSEKPIPKWREFSLENSTDPGGYSHSRSSHVPRNLNYFPRFMDNHPSFYSSTTYTSRWR